jgi:hypothetical protein
LAKKKRIRNTRKPRTQTEAQLLQRQLRQQKQLPKRPLLLPQLDPQSQRRRAQRTLPQSLDREGSDYSRFATAYLHRKDLQSLKNVSASGVFAFPQLSRAKALSPVPEITQKSCSLLVKMGALD